MVNRRPKPASRWEGFPQPDVALLVTSAVEGVRDHGSGFCIANEGNESSVVTCAHVVNELDAFSNGLRVNGIDARPSPSADDHGIDLAILRVPGLKADPVKQSEVSPKVGESFCGFGYAHLHGGHFVSRPLCGHVKQLLSIRAQRSSVGVPALLLAADEDTPFAPGNSGSAILDKNLGVIGILAYASRDGREGYAISMQVLQQFLKGKPGFELSDSLDCGSAEVRPPPPDLDRPKFRDDPQKGRFGGKATDGKVELVPTLGKVSGTSSFNFDVSVRAIEQGLKLLPPARFYLHDTYPRTMIQVRREDANERFTLSGVSSYGVFTVGCHVFASDGQWHAVEYDLADLPGLPKVFTTR